MKQFYNKSFLGGLLKVMFLAVSLFIVVSGYSNSAMEVSYHEVKLKNPIGKEQSNSVFKEVYKNIDVFHVEFDAKKGSAMVISRRSVSKEQIKEMFESAGFIVLSVNTSRVEADTREVELKALERNKVIKELKIK